MAKKYPDEGTLPNVSGPELDKAGIQDTGYLDKKGTPSGDQRVTPTGIGGYIFNKLPPGSNIADQEVADIAPTEKMTIKEVVEMSYPGDDWDDE